MKQKTKELMTAVIIAIIVATIGLMVLEENQEQDQQERKTQFEEYVGGSTIEEIRHNQNVSEEQKQTIGDETNGK